MGRTFLVQGETTVVGGGVEPPAALGVVLGVGVRACPHRHGTLLVVEGLEPGLRGGGHAFGDDPGTVGSGLHGTDPTGAVRRPQRSDGGPPGTRPTSMSHWIADSGIPVRSAMSERAAASASSIAGTVVAASMAGTYSTKRRSETQASTRNLWSSPDTPTTVGGRGRVL